MNDKRKPPTIILAGVFTIMALAQFQLWFFMSAPNPLSGMVVVLTIAGAVMQWVVYFRAYVDFRIDQLRQESSSKD